MAILEDVPGVEVSVQVNGATLHEYEDKNDPDEDATCPTVCKYIECVDDAEFAVQTSVSNDYEWGYRNHTLSVICYVDGKWIRDDLVRAHNTHYVPKTCKVSGRDTYSALTGQWSLRKCKFSAVDTIDEARKERVENDLKIAKDLGVIEVRVRRVIEVGPTGPRSSHDSRSCNSGKFELAEKSLKGKAISHGTSYSPAVATATPNFFDCRDVVEDHGPIAIFKFFYRSREGLQHELIIPRSPSRSPTLEGLSNAERDRLARAQLDQMNIKVKRERQPTIKRESGVVFDLTEDDVPPRPMKKSRLESGREAQVIDLTDD